MEMQSNTFLSYRAEDEARVVRAANSNLFRDPTVKEEIRDDRHGLTKRLNEDTRNLYAKSIMESGDRRLLSTDYTIEPGKKVENSILFL